MLSVPVPVFMLVMRTHGPGMKSGHGDWLSFRQFS